MQSTPVMGLSKPDGSDYISPTYLNDNFDKLDKLGVAYVTQVGNNGTWYWRKWMDGRVEAWCTIAVNNKAVNLAWGNLQRTADFGNTAFPFTFTKTPHMTCTFVTTNNNIAFAVPYTGLTTKKTGSFMLVRGEPGTGALACTGFISVHVSGTVA